jgi:hypothetical protein
MGETKSWEFSGRLFTEEDIELIKEVRALFPKLSLTELAKTVCELTGWVQANGKPKATQGIRFLSKLAEDGVLTLPALDEKKSAKLKGKAKDGTLKDVSWMDTSEVSECGPVRLEIVRPGDRMRQWRTYMSRYHQLGDPVVQGSQMRYAIQAEDGRDLGCMLFSASAWSLAPRDEWIGWDPPVRKARLHLVVNQSRFLLFPWVRVSCLASRSLSMAAKRIQADWLEAYCFAPVLMETFVDSSLYKGTSYKAANWICLGETQGRGRNDRRHEQAETRKAIYVYPLQRDFRAVLKGEKPGKAVEPHV